MQCSICGAMIEQEGIATQAFRRNGLVVTITGIPAIAVCSVCGNAVLSWDIAQQVEDLIKALFTWAEAHTLPKPVITITFPERLAIAA